LSNVKQLPRMPTWKDSFAPKLQPRLRVDDIEPARADMERAIRLYHRTAGPQAFETEIKRIMRDLK
jgi:hypothetical protein